MEMHPSGRKHHVADADALHAAENYVWVLDIGDDPHRQLRLGFDRSGVLRETVVLTGDDGRQLVIHAMKARRQYRELMKEEGW